MGDTLEFGAGSFYFKQHNVMSCIIFIIPVPPVIITIKTTAVSKHPVGGQLILPTPSP